MAMSSWQTLSWIAAGLFLPLFPMSMLFNAAFQRLQNSWLRAALILAWPLPGIWLLTNPSAEMSAGVVPDWVLLWALFTSVLYAFRGIVVREAGIWSGFVATSAWSLLWIAYGITAATETGVAQPLAQSMLVQALTFSLPLVLMVMLVSELVKRYDSAYAGIVSGIAQAQPRLSGLLIIVTLAIIGSPVFPAFFSMLHNITQAIAVQPTLAAGAAVVWLMWSWSAIRLLQELLVGPALVLRHEGPAQESINRNDIGHNDISKGAAFIYGALLVMLVVAGLYITEVLL